VQLSDRSVNAAFSLERHFGCTDDTVSFHNLSSGGDVYSWNFGDGAASSFTNPDHIYLNEGSYPVTLIGSNSWCADTATQTVALQHPLQAAFTPDKDLICEGTSISFANSSIYNAGMGVAKYRWLYGDGATDTAKQPAHTFGAPGDYNVFLIVTDFRNCSDTVNAAITVDPLPEVAVSLSDSIVCAGSSVRMDAHYTMKGNTGIAWQVGNENAQHQPEITRIFDTPGSFPVSFVASYRQCPDVRLERDLLVKPSPRISLGNDTTICYEEKTLWIGDSSTQQQGNVQWSWNTGATTAYINAAHKGTYLATAEIDGCSAKDTIEVTTHTCNCQMNLPSAFTPNNDGRNDVFRAIFAEDCTIKGFELSIFNRWGQNVFHSFDPSQGWDGAQAEPGSYKYKM
ncbi:MAG: PKD domain-containing protein, partial [Sphingobacteriales bacterium]